MDEHIEIIDLNSIQTNRFQPRKAPIELEQLQEMAQTIEQVGLIHPPLVRKIDANTYELIAGERRFRAAKLAGLEKIPVIVRQAEDEQSSLAALIENIQRVDLNPVELAIALKDTSERLNLTQEALSKTLGIKRSTIANYLRVLSLPEIIQQALKQQQITFGHAKVILSIDDKKEQVLLFQMIIRGHLNVRQAEQKAAEIKRNLLTVKPKRPVSRNIFLQQIKDALQKKMGTKVEFIGDEKQGLIQLHYYSLSDLNRLLQVLGYLADE